MSLIFYKRIILGILFVNIFSYVAFADDFEPAEEDIQIMNNQKNISNEYILDADDSGGDIELQFGESLSEFLKWNSMNIRFELSDDLYIDGILEVNGNIELHNNEIKTARLENLSTLPVCDFRNPGQVVYLTSDQHTYVCNATEWKVIDVAGAGTTPYLFLDQTYSVQPNDTDILSLMGLNFDATSVVDIPGFGGTIHSITVVNPGQIDIEITADGIVNDYDIVVSNGGAANTLWGGNGVDALRVAVTGTGPRGTYAESFETDFGQWMNSNFDVAWSRDSAGTPSNTTGPNVGSNGNFYLYTEASSPNYPAKTFGIETEYFAVATSLSFDYHMYGSAMGNLEVQTYYNGNWTTIHTLSGQQQAAQTDSYKNVNLDLTSYNVEKIRFFYTSGSAYQGDCAIDNVIIVSH